MFARVLRWRWRLARANAALGVTRLERARGLAGRLACRRLGRRLRLRRGRTRRRSGVGRRWTRLRGPRSPWERATARADDADLIDDDRGEVRVVVPAMVVLSTRVPQGRTRPQGIRQAGFRAGAVHHDVEPLAQAGPARWNRCRSPRRRVALFRVPPTRLTLAPARRATHAQSKPSLPSPTIASATSEPSSTCSVMRNAAASGSMKTACRSSTVPGMRCRLRTGTRTRSAIAPSRPRFLGQSGRDNGDNGRRGKWGNRGKNC